VNVETVPLDSLHADPANVRRHPERNLAAIKASLARFGQQHPIIVDADGVVRAGNGRLEAARQLGWDTINVVRTDLEGSDATAFSIADNRTGELAEWDDTALAETLRSLQSEDFDLAAIGYDAAEIDGLCERLGSEMLAGQEPAEDPGPQVDRAAELQAKWGTATGQLWVIPSKATPGKQHRLLCGDSTKAEDVARVMGGEKARLIITSPPYNQQLGSQSQPTGMHSDNAWFHRLDSAYSDAMPEDEYQEWQVETMTLWFEHASDGAAFFYNHKHRYRDRRPIIPLSWIARTPWELRQEIIWDRRGGVAANAGMFIPGDERIYWLEKDGQHTWNGVGNNRTTVWPISPQANDGLHVCPYPMELVTIPVESVTDPGDSVADPFAGSGTTIVAAEQAGRLCRGIEIAPKYCGVILERLAGMGLEPAISISGNG
jgi:DNA modification methylase